MVDRSLAVAMAAAPQVDVRGTFQRHTSPHYRTLAGSRSGGRWGRPGAYPVIYVGRPMESIVAEAYRHLVDPTEGMTGEHVGPRVLITCEVSIAAVLDLREPFTAVKLGVTSEDLQGYDYTKCQRLGAAAHQLGLGGIIAPAATRLGETLAIFERNLRESDSVTLLTEDVWAKLPVDPRPAALPIAALLSRHRLSRRSLESTGAEDDEQHD